MLTAVALLLLAGCVLPLRAQASSTCLGLDDRGAFIRSAIVGLVSATDTAAATGRQQLGLTLVDSSQVTIVSDSRTCDKAAAAVNTLQNTVGAPRPLYVYKIGKNRFAVFDAAPRQPGATYEFTWSPVFYFDSKWVSLGARVI